MHRHVLQYVGGPCARLALRSTCRLWRDLAAELYGISPLRYVHIKYEAAEYGYMSVLIWLYELGITVDERMFALAAAGRYTDILDWMHVGGHVAKMSTAMVAREVASIGYTDMLLQMTAKYPQMHADPSIIACAAAGGHWDTVWQLRAQDPPFAWNAATCTAAVAYPDQFKRLRRAYCPFNAAEVLSDAARTGQLETLQYCLDNGVQCRSIIPEAIAGGRLRVLQQIYAHDKRIFTDDTYSPSLHECAMQCTHDDVFAWMCSISGRMDEFIEHALTAGNIAAFRRIIHNRPTNMDLIVYTALDMGPIGEQFILALVQAGHM